MTGETVFLDTDIGTDCDDAGAMALLHHLLPGSGMRAGAMVCSAPLPDSSALIRHINAYFGCFCPVGRVQSRAAAGMYRDVYAGEVLRRRGAYREAPPCPKAVPLLRRELSRCPDHSAVYVAIGPQTNMAALLLSSPDEESPLGGRELLERKLRRTVVMAGRFVDETPEYNVLADIGAARLTAADWPGEMTYVPHELGAALITGNGFLMKIITTACFVVGAVFLFCTASFSSIGIAEGAKEMWEAMVKEGLIKLQAGPIIAGILAILGAIVCFFKGTIAKKIGD